MKGTSYGLVPFFMAPIGKGGDLALTTMLKALFLQ